MWEKQSVVVMAVVAVLVALAVNPHPVEVVQE
jgi:hypothetical protein